MRCDDAPHKTKAETETEAETETPIIPTASIQLVAMAIN